MLFGLQGLATTQAKVKAAEDKLDQVKQQLKDHEDEIKSVNEENEALYDFYRYISLFCIHFKVNFYQFWFLIE